MPSLNRLLALILSGLLIASCATPPPPKPTVPDPADDLYGIAMDSARSGDAEAAAEQFQILIEMKPDYPLAHTNLGLQLIRLKRYDEAREALEQAISQDKNDAVAYNHLGILARREGQFDKALDYYNKAIEANSEYAKAYLNRGILLDLYKRDWPAALEDYQRYQSLLATPDTQVKKWIIDIKRRINGKTGQ